MQQDFLSFICQDSKQIIIGYVTLEDVCNWNYNTFLTEAFLLQKTKHDYQDWIYESTAVKDWKETHLFLNALKHRKANVVTLRDLILYPTMSYPLEERWWQQESAYEKITDLQLGDIVLVADNQLALVQNSVHEPIVRLVLKLNGTSVLSGIPDMFSDCFFSLPLHFWSNVKEINSMEWRLHYTNRVREACVLFAHNQHHQLAFLMVFVQDNVSYGILSLYHNQKTTSVQYPVPERCWKYINSSFLDLFREYNLTTNRIMMHPVLAIRLLEWT
jgi:hypothetical protein